MENDAIDSLIDKTHRNKIVLELKMKRKEINERQNQEDHSRLIFSTAKPRGQTLTDLTSASLRLGNNLRKISNTPSFRE